MSGISWKRGWRSAVGLIAAYAFVLHAFLAYSIATQAAARDASSYSGIFLVLCVSNDGTGTSHDADAPIKPNTHCPICTLSVPAAAILPDCVVLPLWQAALSQRTPFASVAACVSWHQARAGLSRAPPLQA